MPDPASGPGERVSQSAARGHARQAVTGLARDRGTEFTSRPLASGSGLAARDLGPLDGARAARDIELSARHAARDYIRAAREAGHSWDQIGQALGRAPNADADQAGLTVAEAAYTYAAGNPYPDTAGNEPGHADGCPRLAQATADWDAGWEIEP
jgi:hypothetical protein